MLTVSIFVINVALSRPFIDALLFSLAIAIGITPQLLPAIVTVSLSTGSRALARKRVLVKRLVTIEDLGNIEVLFTDKTGTLTEGAITFHEALDALGDRELRRAPARPRVQRGDHRRTRARRRQRARPRALAAPAAAPLLAAPDGVAAHERLGLLPFDHDRQLASVVTRTPDGATTLVTKGAPEAVLARCVDDPRREPAPCSTACSATARASSRSRRAPRPGLDAAGGRRRARPAARRLPHLRRPAEGRRRRGDRQARPRSGIAVKVITGDNGTVAAKVCRDIGLAVDGVLTGAEIEALDDDALAAAIPQTTIFARVGPEQKSRLIKVARRTGVDVAFLGDGVNDAVALHAADVGISVDSATDVAKDAADIVLLDKDLGVLADGVVEGRRIFANTLKYVLMATSSNFGNMFSAAGASLFLSFLPMLPSQILLNNLLYDAGQMTIPTDHVDPEMLARPAAWDIALHPPLHGRLRPAQLDLRLPDVLRDARRS